MVEFYFFLVLLNGAICLAVAAIAFRRNFREMVGALISGAIFLMGLWFIGFAQYFHAGDQPHALLWGKFTLSLGVINTPMFLHSVCVSMKRQRRDRLMIIGSYLTGFFCVALIWGNLIISGLKHLPYMDHYLSYNRAWYPVLIGHIAGWQWVTAIVLVLGARRAVGYLKTQLSYFAAAWFVIFLTTNSIIMPMEYDIQIQPFGFFIMPLNLIMLGYVMAKARLVDVNIVIARGLLYTVSLIIVAALCLLFVGAMTLVSPGFMNPQQILFVVALVLVIGMGLAITLPQFLPYAEHLVQERFFAGRFSYQDILTNLIRELSSEGTVETLLNRVVTTVQSQMQVSRVLIFLQDPLLDEYALMAHSGVLPEERDRLLPLRANGPITHWLGEHKDALVRDEQARMAPPAVWPELAGALDRLQVSLCVPLLIEGKLMGVLALGAKANGDMFFVSDLRLLTTLATEVALGVRYRRMEEQAVRNNKLVALGTIAAGVAHEIRNPLASIRTFAQLLPTNHDDPEFRDEFSKLVLQDVERITKVIQSMLSFARPAAMNVGLHTAEELIDEALTLIQPRLRGKQIEVSKQLPHRLTLSVDKQQILQVLLNILNNAVDVLPAGGVIRITTGIQPPENKSKPAEACFAIISIADNGPGIPAAARARLFDPFFTTKPEGTGLGLSISQKIARDHNGFIAVSSSEGMGAAFQIHLPLDWPVFLAENKLFTSTSVGV